MSLIVDALKRAQEGATRRLPPLSTARGPLPGLVRSGDGARRLWTVVGGLIAIAGVAGGGIWLARGSLFRETPKPIALAPPLVVVETVPATPPAPSSNPPSEEATVPGQSRGGAAPPRRAARPVRTPRAARVGAPGPATTPATVPPAAGASASPVTGPTVEVHVDRAQLAADAMAAGIVDQQRGDLARAIEQYRRGIDADPRNPGLFNNLGTALRQSGRLDDAAQAFQEALKIDPKYEKALNNLGVTRYQQGKYEAAIDLFKQAIQIDPANAESHVNLGVIYLPAGRWDDALTAFQDALRYNPRSAEAYYNLALLWERRGDPDRAQEDYERFVELAGPQHAELAARVKERLRQFDHRR
jgi:tetratricopeptide (TPR) repeat protein